MSKQRFEARPVPPEARVCVLYDAESGEVLHLHQIIAMAGAPPPTDEELKAEAYELAAEARKRAQRTMDSLIVPVEAFDRSVAYCVDVKKRRLQEIDRAPTPGRDE